jgi:nicotinate-nucleotide pyrophosphorylase (carboxylating)
MPDWYSGLVPETQIAELVNGWLREDCPNYDVAGAVIYGHQATAQILCKASGTLCGKPFIQIIFDTLNCSIKWHYSEGDLITVMDQPVVVADICGEARNLLLGERVALNILARASAIATR